MNKKKLSIPKKCKNILFIGGCFCLQGTKFLPNFLENFDNLEINIKICFLGDYKFPAYIENIETNLKEIDIIHKRIINYNNKKNYNYITNRNPKISIYELVKSKKWDAICLSVFNTGDYSSYIYDLSKTYLFDFLSLIKENANAVYVLREAVRLNSFNYLCEKKKYNKKHKDFPFFKNDDELYEIITKNMLKMEKELGFTYIPSLECFHLLKESKLNNENNLLRDGWHLDPYIGCYLYASCIYYSIFYKWTNKKLSDMEIDIPFKEVQYTYKKEPIDCYAVPVTKENKYISDNIVESYYNIKNLIK